MNGDKTFMLIIEYPSCGLCGDETSHDGDVLFCEGCNLSWSHPHEDEPSERYDPEMAMCGAVHDGKGFAPLGAVCLRGEGHDGYHHASPIDWWKT